MSRQVRAEKFSEVAFADKAYTRAVLFFRRRQTVFKGDFTHFGLLNILQRKKYVGQLPLRQLIEKISLILILIGGLQKAVDAVFVGDFAVMSRGDIVGTQFFCLF